MSFARILALAARIAQQVRRDHRSMALLFGAPILILALLGYLLRAQESNTITLGVANRDQPVAPLNLSLAGRVLDQLGHNDRLALRSFPGDGAARAAVRDGAVDAALIFSPTFSADVLARRPVAIGVILEGANPAKTGSTLPVVQGALLQAMSSLSAALPGAAASAPPQIRLAPDLLYGSIDLKPLDYLAPLLIGFFAFFLIFLLTCVSFLRERTQGTMERLAASPITRGEIVVGYMLGFGLFALVQSGIIVLFTAYVLQVRYTGNLFWVFLVTIFLALGAVNLGIFLSTFARSELQAVQFIPIVLAPQVFLCGVLWPVADMPGWLQVVAHALPLTYANQALTDIMIRGKGLTDDLLEFAVLLGFAGLMVAIAALTLRREVA
jgi:ABC-2 type transport system permease protein